MVFGVNRVLVGIAIVCMVIALVPSIAVYSYFNHVVEAYKVEIESYKVQLANWTQESEAHKERIREHMKPYDPYLMEPYLTTSLGWYLHNNSDPFPESRNKLTIYGQVLNIGAKTAYNCKLKVIFYRGSTVVQTSEINFGTIGYWGFDYTRENIDCKLADSVTRIEVERTWTNTP